MSSGTPVRARALVVEDEAVVSMFLQRALERLGVGVVAVASNAAEAVSLALSTTVDVVLLDVQLRGKHDGVWVAEQLREKTDVAIIFLSGEGGGAVKDRVRATRPDGFLEKPFKPAELERVLGPVLTARRSS